MSKQAPAIQEIEWSAVEGGNTEFEVQYPRMQWHHGDKKASGFNKTGGLFIPKDQYPNFSGEGFEKCVLITDDGTEIDGFGAAETKLAVIRIKHQWVKDDSKNIPLAHALCVVQGCDDLICISLKGPTKALEFQKAFNQHIGQNVQLANRTRPATASQLEPFALWFPIRAGEQSTASSKDGKAQSKVTFPEMIAPETVDRNYVVTLWVGADNYKKFASYWRDTKQWQNKKIWEQRDPSDSDLSDMTGGDGPATQEQLEHLVMLCEAKGFDEAEVMQGITHGARSKFTELTRTEARQVTDELKAK
jgi:hypothetical protein